MLPETAETQSGALPEVCRRLAPSIFPAFAVRHPCAGKLPRPRDALSATSKSVNTTRRGILSARRWIAVSRPRVPLARLGTGGKGHDAGAMFRRSPSSDRSSRDRLLHVLLPHKLRIARRARLPVRRQEHRIEVFVEEAEKRSQARFRITDEILVAQDQVSGVSEREYRLHRSTIALDRAVIALAGIDHRGDDVPAVADDAENVKLRVERPQIGIAEAFPRGLLGQIGFSMPVSVW